MHTLYIFLMNQVNIDRLGVIHATLHYQRFMSKSRIILQHSPTRPGGTVGKFGFAIEKWDIVFLQILSSKVGLKQQLFYSGTSARKIKRGIVHRAYKAPLSYRLGINTDLQRDGTGGHLSVDHATHPCFIV
jgi:hypothetical protein